MASFAAGTSEYPFIPVYIHSMSDFEIGRDAWNGVFSLPGGSILVAPNKVPQTGSEYAGHHK
jgi:hypothetical protein